MVWENLYILQYGCNLWSLRVMTYLILALVGLVMLAAMIVGDMVE